MTVITISFFSPSAVAYSTNPIDPDGPRRIQ